MSLLCANNRKGETAFLLILFLFYFSLPNISNSTLVTVLRYTVQMLPSMFWLEIKHSDHMCSKPVYRYYLMRKCIVHLFGCRNRSSFFIAQRFFSNKESIDDICYGSYIVYLGLNYSC